MYLDVISVANLFYHVEITSSWSSERFGSDSNMLGLVQRLWTSGSEVFRLGSPQKCTFWTSKTSIILIIVVAHHIPSMASCTIIYWNHHWILDLVEMFLISTTELIWYESRKISCSVYSKKRSFFKFSLYSAIDTKFSCFSLWSTKHALNDNMHDASFSGFRPSSRLESRSLALMNNVLLPSWVTGVQNTSGKVCECGVKTVCMSGWRQSGPGCGQCLHSETNYICSQWCQLCVG